MKITKRYIRAQFGIVFVLASFVPIIFLAAYLSGQPLIALLSVLWFGGWGLVLYYGWVDFVHIMLAAMVEQGEKQARIDNASR